jgi:membrane protein
MAMREFPKGGLIGKSVTLWRRISGFRVPLYAANASFFIVLAVFPALLILLGLLRYTPLEVERLGEMLAGFLPDALLESAEELILLTYDNTSGLALGLSVVTTLWSASRGIYGIIGGLNAVYEVTENRGYIHIRLLSVVYTFAFLLVLLLTLGLHVFGTKLLILLRRAKATFFVFLLEFIDLRFFLLLVLQTGIFTLLYMVLPNGGNRFGDSLPGALLASSGWLVFSDLYSVYVERFARLTNVYGSVYAVALSMLWLYFCMAIVFYGGVLNRLLMDE